MSGREEGDRPLDTEKKKVSDNFLQSGFDRVSPGFSGLKDEQEVRKYRQ